MAAGKKLCHQNPARLKLGSSRHKVQKVWLAWRLDTKHWKRASDDGDDLSQLSQGLLRNPARRLKRKRLGPQAELEKDLLPVLFEGGQEGLADIGGVDVALGRAGFGPAPQRVGHFLVAGQPVIDVGRRGRSQWK